MGDFTVKKKSVNQVEYQGKTYTCNGERIVMDGQSRYIYRDKKGLDLDIIVCDDISVEQPQFTHFTKFPGGCYTVPSEVTNEYEYVDLGLPSGTMWATENIKDANGNELYFAWGETQGYTAEQVGTDKYFSNYGDHADYKYCTYEFHPELGWEEPTFTYTKYNNSDGKKVLDEEDDAATANWGEGWKMPTKEQFEELKANTSYEWTEVNGVQGAKFTSTIEGHTDKFLFFPAVGYKSNGKDTSVLSGYHGFYWSASLYTSVGSALELRLGDNDCILQYMNRYQGLNVRPVRVSH